MAKRQLPPQGVLRQLLTYEPETGKLFWKERGPEWFVSKRGESLFKAKFEGKEALSCLHTEGYLYGRINGEKFFAHRVIWKLVHGDDPQFIDHINGLRSDNRIANLRSVSRLDNQRNMRLQHRNRTGVHGIHLSKGRWYARIRHEGEYISLGSFASMDEAIDARKAAEAAYGYHPNHGK